MIYISQYHSPLGHITMESNGDALTGLWLAGQKDFNDSLPEQYESKDLPVFVETRQWLDIYFHGKDPGFIPPLCMEGIYISEGITRCENAAKSFRMAVWEILLTIPYGQTVTYGEIAAQIAKQRGIQKMSAQAVGGAVGHNPISIIVPCHRVIGANGNLTGYAGGIDKKVKLLTQEKVNLSKMFIPKGRDS